LANQAKFGHVLDFSGKRAEIVPSQVWEAVGGEAVAKALFGKNNFTAIPREIFAFSASLQDLDMSFNRLAELPAEVGLLRALTSIDLRNNQLRHLPIDLASLGCLTEVIISMNRFSAFPDVFYAMPGLLSIIASDNQIMGVDADAMLGLQKLNCLDLTNNDINKVPPELGLLPAIKSLKLEGNSFKIPRPAILAKGTPAILEYLRDRISPTFG
jgi:Leucine-rich repeat (LRR) protein